MPPDPFANDGDWLDQSIQDGLLLWDILTSYEDVRGFFRVLSALEPDDLRNVIVAVRALAIEQTRVVETPSL